MSETQIARLLKKDIKDVHREIKHLLFKVGDDVTAKSFNLELDRTMLYLTGEVPSLHIEMCDALDAHDPGFLTRMIDDFMNGEYRSENPLKVVPPEPDVETHSSFAAIFYVDDDTVGFNDGIDKLVAAFEALDEHDDNPHADVHDTLMDFIDTGCEKSILKTLRCNNDNPCYHRAVSAYRRMDMIFGRYAVSL